MALDRDPDAKQTQPPGWTFPSSRPSDPAALASAAKVITEVAKNEETRFSNLNTRAAAILSAISIVTGILGITSKNIFDKSLSSDQQAAAVVGLLLTLALLLAAAGSLVFGVLRPKARYVFGNNVLTTEDSNVRLSAQDIDELVFLEYGHIYIALAARSSAKARWLNLAYLLFFLALAAGVVAVGAVAFLAV